MSVPSETKGARANYLDINTALVLVCVFHIWLLGGVSLRIFGALRLPVAEWVIPNIEARGLVS